MSGRPVVLHTPTALAGGPGRSAPAGHPSLPVDHLDTISLEELAAVAALTSRHDAKYVVARSALPRLLEALGPRSRVLDVDGRRSAAYASVYFDTPGLLTYHEHVQGRRRRWKLRTRHYGDPDHAMLELKRKGVRGRTIKHRWPHEAHPEVLDAAGWQRADEVLRAAYGSGLPQELVPAVSTAYRRTTLVDTAAGERLTIDEDLTIVAAGRELHLGAQVAVVESKAGTLRGVGVRALGELGLRPDRVSKYCLAVASAYDDVRGNPWLPVLRRMQPAAGAGD